MNTPQVYMCSPSWTLLPPPSPFHPSGSSQCTSPKHPVSCIKIVCSCCDSEETNLLISLLLGHSLWRKDWEIYILYILSLLSHVQLFGTPWTAALQAPLSFTTSQSLLKFMSIESLMLSNLLSLCHPFSFCLQSFPASGSFPMSQLFTSGSQSIKLQLQQQSFQWIFRVDLL